MADMSMGITSAPPTTDALDSGVDGGMVDYQAISIVLRDSQNNTLFGTLNFTVWRETEEEEDYDEEGAAYYVIAVVLVYGLSMVLLIGSLAKRKMGDKNVDVEENQVNRFLEQMPDLREKNARDNYRQLKQDIRALVNKDSTATTSSLCSPPTSPLPQTPGEKTTKSVMFDLGDNVVAKDKSGTAVLVISGNKNEADSGKKKTSDKADENEKEYLLSVSKSGFSEDSASSVFDHSNNSRTALLKEPISPAPKSKFDKVKEWPVVENPSDIWVSYEPETDSTSVGLSPRMGDDRIPLGYSPTSQHKSFNMSLPNSPSPSANRRERPWATPSVRESGQLTTSGQLRTYFEPLKSEPSPISPPYPTYVSSSPRQKNMLYSPSDFQNGRHSAGSLEEVIHQHLHSPKSRSPRLSRASNMQEPVRPTDFPSSPPQLQQNPTVFYHPIPINQQLPPPIQQQPYVAAASIEPPYNPSDIVPPPNAYLLSPTAFQNLPPHQRRSWGGIPSQHQVIYPMTDSTYLSLGFVPVAAGHHSPNTSQPTAFYTDQFASSPISSPPAEHRRWSNTPITSPSEHQKPLSPPSPNARRLSGDIRDSPLASRVHRPLYRVAVSPTRSPQTPRIHSSRRTDDLSPLAGEMQLSREYASPVAQRGSGQARTPSPYRRGKSPTPTYVAGRHVTADIANTLKSIGKKEPDESQSDLMQVTSL